MLVVPAVRRPCLLLVALTFLLCGVGALPACADDPPPLVPPPAVTDDPGAGATAPAGPTYEVTPGVGGSHLGNPVDPTVAAQHATAPTSPTPTPTTQRTARRRGTTGRRPGVAPAAVAPTGSAAASDHEDLAWELGAGAFLLLVLAELVRVARRPRRRPAPS